MKTTWIDLTDFTIWRGVHTGTQRVVYQIAKYFADSESVRFCSYNYNTRAYNEVAFSDVFSQNDSSAASRKSKLSNGSQKLKKTYHLLVPPIVSRIVSKASSKNNSTVDIVDVVINIDFNDSDVLLVLGGNWDKPGFIDALEQSVNKGAKLVHNINDFIPIVDKGHVSSDEHVRYESFMKRVLACAAMLTAISEHTKKDIESYCKKQNIVCPPVYVMRLGDNLPTKDVSKVEAVSTPYILTVSTVEVRKNHILLYYAYKEAVRRGIQLPELVIAGKRGWLTGDLQFMLQHDPEIREKIKIIEAPSDEQLAWLYKNCLFTVYPSYYEGWGLPVAESLLFGKTCLASDASSIPEIAGSSLDYFSPFDSAACLDGMVKLLDEDYRKKKEAIIKNNYKPTSWEETAQKLSRKLATI